MKLLASFILAGMVIAVAFLVLQTGPAGPSLANLDKWAQARDVATLAKHLEDQPAEGKQAINLIKTNGAYGVGGYGWKAQEMTAPDRTRYVVFTTPLTSEDIGELVFARTSGGKLKYLREQNDLGVQVAKHDLQVAFEFAKQKASIVATTTFKTGGRGPGHFLIRMSPTYKVRSITNGGQKVPYSQAGGVVAIARPKGKPQFTLKIAYDGIVTTKGYAGSVTAGEAQLTNDYWYPMIARLPAPYTMTVRTPKGWTAVGQGELVSKTDKGNETLYRFRMDLPVVYYSMSVGPYRSISEPIKGHTMSTWSLKLSEQEMRDQNRLYSEIVDFFSRTFAPFPFKGYGAISTDLYEGGALEAYSFTTWSTGVLPEEDAHEPAHTYWGGWINNTYLESFWNESFASYSEGLFDRECGIGSTEERRLAFIPDMSPSPGFKAAPVFGSGVDVGPVAGELGYGKGSLVLYMLEEQIGRERALECMRNWLKTTPKGAVGDWPDFIKACEATLGKTNPPIGAFFDQWLKRTGWPEFEIEGVAWAAGKLSGRLRFTGEAYRLPLEVLSADASGTVRLDKVFVGSGPFSVSIPSKPTLVSFDPWLKLLRNIGDDERPASIASLLGSMRRFNDPKRPDYLQEVDVDQTAPSLPENLNGIFLVGHPDTLPAMQPLCAAAGFNVSGDSLTYKGTTIDLKQGGAIAIVDLPNGGRCAIGLGKTRVEPNLGRAKVAIFDVLGRFLRGTTLPKSSGRLTYKL